MVCCLEGSVRGAGPLDGDLWGQNEGLKEVTMTRAVWNGAVIAESDRCVVVEGNQYFPPDAVRREYLKESATHTTCSWKGVASYYDVAVEGRVNKDAAWYYPSPKEAAQVIQGHIAFWKGVKVDSGG